MDLRNFNESQLKTILRFTEKLVEKQTASGGINFDVPDVEQAEISAKEFAHRRNAGYRTTEIEGDAETRKGIQEWMRRTNRKSTNFG